MVRPLPMMEGIISFINFFILCSSFDYMLLIIPVYSPYIESLDDLDQFRVISLTSMRLY